MIDCALWVTMLVMMNVKVSIVLADVFLFHFLVKELMLVGNCVNGGFYDFLFLLLVFTLVSCHTFLTSCIS